MESSIVYNVQQGPFWDWKVAVDLFLGGAGVGALLLAVFVDEIFRGRHRDISQTGAWLSPLLVTSGLVLLLFKLGQPLRLPLTYVNFAPRSPLWWGGILQPLFVAGGFLYALLWIRADSGKVGRRVLGGALAAIGVMLGAYHGLLLSVIAARPLWNTGLTVVAALLSALATGIAGVMLTHLLRLGITGRLFDQEQFGAFPRDMGVVRNALMGTLVAQLGTVFLWWLSLYFGSLQDQQALAAASAAYGPMFCWLGVGLGLVLPLGLGALVVWLGEAAHGGLQVGVIGLSSAMILVGGFFFRLAVVLGGQVSLPVNIF